MRAEGVVRMSRLRRKSSHRSAQAVLRPPDDCSDPAYVCQVCIDLLDTAWGLAAKL